MTLRNIRVTKAISNMLKQRFVNIRKVIAEGSRSLFASCKKCFQCCWLNVQETIKGPGNVSLKYLLCEKPQRLVNYRVIHSLSLVKGISRHPQCPSQMQAWIESVGISVTGALDTCSSSANAPHGNSPWALFTVSNTWVPCLGKWFWLPAIWKNQNSSLHP